MCSVESPGRSYPRIREGRWIGDGAPYGASIHHTAVEAYADARMRLVGKTKAGDPGRITTSSNANSLNRQTDAHVEIEAKGLFAALANLTEAQARRVSRLYAVPPATAATIAALAYGVRQ